MTPWAHALRVSFVESVGCCDTNTFPKTKTLLFHLTPYRKIRPRRSENTQDPGSPLPSDPIFRLGLHVKKPGVADCVSESVPSFGRLVRGSAQK